MFCYVHHMFANLLYPNNINCLLLQFSDKSMFHVCLWFRNFWYTKIDLFQPKKYDLSHFDLI